VSFREGQIGAMSTLRIAELTRGEVTFSLATL